MNYNTIRAQFEGNGSGNRPTHIYGQLLDGTEVVIACRRPHDTWEGVQYCEIRGKSYFLFEDRYFDLQHVDDEIERLWREGKVTLQQYNEFFLYMDMLMLGYHFNPHYKVKLCYSEYPTPRLVEGTITDLWMNFIDWDESIDRTLMEPDDGADVELDNASIGTFADPPSISAEADGPLEAMEDIIAVWTVPGRPVEIDLTGLTINLQDGQEIIDLTDDFFDIE